MIEKSLDYINRVLPEGVLIDVTHILTMADIEEAPKTTPTGKAPRMSGIIGELWKDIHEKYERTKKMAKLIVQIYKVLGQVLNDIVANGAVEDCKFVIGLLCSVYKKGSARLI